MSDTPLPQDAFRSHTVSEEDKYFQKREQEILEDLRGVREARGTFERHCPCADCQGVVLERVPHDNVEIDICPRCKGVWLDAGELELLTGRAKDHPNALQRFFRNLAGDYTV